MNWYRLAQILWEEAPNEDDLYLHLGDEPDAMYIPIDNIFVPNEQWNTTYRERIDEYRDMMIGGIPVEPIVGTIRKELTPYIYNSLQNNGFWLAISDSPQYGKPYATINNGVHRTRAAQKSGAKEIKVIRDLGSNSDWF